MHDRGMWMDVFNDVLFWAASRLILDASSDTLAYASTSRTSFTVKDPPGLITCFVFLMRGTTASLFQLSAALGRVADIDDVMFLSSCGVACQMS